VFRGQIGRLDLQLTYLWRVHGVDYYNGVEVAEPSAEQRAAPRPTVRGPRPEEGEQPDEVRRLGLGFRVCGVRRQAVGLGFRVCGVRRQEVGLGFRVCGVRRQAVGLGFTGHAGHVGRWPGYALYSLGLGFRVGV
jgi:hypothetical protein